MAAGIQVLLSLFCVLFAHGHIAHRKTERFGSSHQSKKSGTPASDGVDVHALYSPLNPDLSIRPAKDDRPINGDIFSYNTQHTYDNYYRDSNYNPNVYPFIRYPGPFGGPNYDNMPLGYPNIGYNRPGHRLPSYANTVGADSNPSEDTDADDNNSSEESNDDQKPKDDQQSVVQKDKSPLTDKNLETLPPKTNIANNNGVPSNNNVDLQPNKDYLLVGTGGNSLYLLHENVPSTNAVVMPSNNQPTGSNVVYVPYNPQPGSPVYQVVSGQPSASTSIPVTANRVNSNDYNNNVMTTPVQNNPPANSNIPSYVLLYANGQLIQIPGVVVNTAQNNPNVPNSMTNAMYTTQPGNQGNTAVSNGVSNPGLVVTNPQYVSNPNNNVGNNGNGNQPASVSQPNNVANGYVQPNGVYNVVNPNTANPPSGLYTVANTNTANPPNTMYNVVNPNSVNPPNNMYNVANPNSANPPNNMYNVANPNSANPSNNMYNNANPNNGNPSNTMYNAGNPNNGNNNPGSNNNPSIQPAYSLPINNNAITYPTQEKDDNTGAPATNNIQPYNVQPNNPQPATQPPLNDNNSLLVSIGVQPAIMVSGFKETDGKKGKKHEDKDEVKEKSQNKEEVLIADDK